MKFRDLSRDDKWTIAIFFGTVAVGATFWAFAIAVAWHFIAKFW